MNMAAVTVPNTKIPPVCLICLSDVQQKVVGECRHAFCKPCLLAHFNDRDIDIERVFLCPTCHSKCSYPEAGVEGLTDFIPGADTGEVILKVKGSDEGRIENSLDVGEEGELPKKKCRICCNKDLTTIAGMFCEKCDVYLCEECCGVHKRSSGTKTHVLTPIGSPTCDSAGICKHHGERQKMYCTPCAIPGCGVCISIDHSEHDVSPIKDVLGLSVVNLQKVIKDGQYRMRLLEDHESAASSAKKAKIEWEETVIRTIEDKSESCINNILEQKYKLLQSLREDCQTSTEDQYLKNMARIRGEVSESVAAGERLLADVKAHPKYFKRLDEMKATIKKELDSDANGVSKIAVDYKRPFSFLAESDPVKSIGSMTKNPTLTVKKLMDLEMPTDTKYSSICEVRCLGKIGYAVVCRPDSEELTDDFLVFDTDGKLQNADKGMPRVYGMDVDSGDQAVLLTSGEKDGMFCVRAFDSRKGTSKSSKEFPLTKPLSMTVSPEGGYYILCEGKGDTRIITAVDTKGSITQTSPIAYPGIGDHFRVTCGWNYIYTMGASTIAVCGMVEGKITFLRSVNHSHMMDAIDVSANLFDEVYVIIRANIGFGYSQSAVLHRLTHDLQISKLQNIPGIDRTDATRFHIHNHTLLLTNNNIVTVYKLDLHKDTGCSSGPFC